MDSEHLHFEKLFAGQYPYASRWFGDFVTPSGRRFKYEFSEYPIRVGTTPEQALALARRIFSEKYRYSEWDRRHPDVDVEQEIVFGLICLILHVAARLEGKDPLFPQLITSWGIDFDGELIEVYPDSARGAAEQRLNDLIARDGSGYVLRRITRIRLPSNSG